MFTHKYTAYVKKQIKTCVSKMIQLFKKEIKLYIRAQC